MLENARPLSFAANVNVGIAATTGEYVLVCQPRRRAGRRTRSARLVAFADAHPRAGLVGPLRALAGRDVAAVAAPLPDRARDDLAPNAAAAAAPPPYEHQVSHYGTRPHGARAGRLAARRRCLLMRRAMLDEIGGWDGGYRHYVEDIDVALPRRASGLGALARSRARSRATTTRR